VRARQWLLALSVLLVGGAGAALAAGVLGGKDEDSLSVTPPTLATAPRQPLTTKLPVVVPDPASTITTTTPLQP
jgi:hypothetical protein